jgi:hypothetical protein
MQRGNSTFKPGVLLASVVEGTTWKCSGVTVHLKWGMRFGTLNVRSLCSTDSLTAAARELVRRWIFRK